MTVYDCAGLEVALPNEYLDQLLVDTDVSRRGGELEAPDLRL